MLDLKKPFAIFNYRDMEFVGNIEQVGESDLQDVLSLQKAAFMEVAKQMDNYNIPPLLQNIQDIQAGQTHLKRFAYII